MPEAVDQREAFRRESHALPAGWCWAWQDNVFSFQGGTQPPAAEFKAVPQTGYVRLVQIRDYYNDSHATFVPDSPNLHKCKPDDVMLARYGSNSDDSKNSLGRVCRGIDGAYNVALVKIQPRVGVERDFLFYLLKTAYFQEPLKGRAGRSVQAGFNREGLRSILLPLPPHFEQRAIAEVLGALDDKIAANAKLAAIATVLAEVKFKTLAKGIPVSESTFDDIAAIGGGGTPSTSVPGYWNGEVPWLTPTDVTALAGPYLERTSRSITNAGLAACASPLYPIGSIMMTSRATIGAFAVAQKPTAVNQGFIVVNPRNAEMKWWLFHEMKDRVEEFLTHANGATFMELSRGNFKRLKVRLAAAEVMSQFGVMVETLHASARQALVESRSLAETRDALLPALMSGRLRVKDAERQVEQVL